MLIWADNKLVMASLLKDFRGNFDLIKTQFPMHNDKAYKR